MNTLSGINVTTNVYALYSTSVIMVKLPYESDQPNRDGERSARTSRQNWRSRLSRRDGFLLHTEPRGLLELEELARRTVKLMERHSPKSEKNFDRAMDLLRLQ